MDEAGSTMESRGKVVSKVNELAAGERMLVVWSPEECSALKDLLARLAKIDQM